MVSGLKLKDASAKGIAVESRFESGSPVATVLVHSGTLRVGDIIICGRYYSKVLALISKDGQRIKEAGPSATVKVLGLNGVPQVGLELSAVEDEKVARELVGQRARDARVPAPRPTPGAQHEKRDVD
jgi:translation initiation factor IF-2